MGRPCQCRIECCPGRGLFTEAHRFREGSPQLFAPHWFTIIAYGHGRPCRPLAGLGEKMEPCPVVLAAGGGAEIFLCIRGSSRHGEESLF